MTVRELIRLLTNARDLDDNVFVDNQDENNPVQLEDVEVNNFNYGFVIGKIKNYDKTKIFSKKC